MRSSSAVKVTCGGGGEVVGGGVDIGVDDVAGDVDLRARGGGGGAERAQSGESARARARRCEERRGVMHGDPRARRAQVRMAKPFSCVLSVGRDSDTACLTLELDADGRPVRPSGGGVPGRSASAASQTRRWRFGGWRRGGGRGLRRGRRSAGALGGVGEQGARAAATLAAVKRSLEELGDDAAAGDEVDHGDGEVAVGVGHVAGQISAG